MINSGLVLGCTVALWLVTTLGGPFAKAFLATINTPKPASTAGIQKIIDSVRSGDGWQIDSEEDGTIRNDLIGLLIRTVKKDQLDTVGVLKAEYLNSKIAPPRFTDNDVVLLREAMSAFTAKVQDDYLDARFSSATRAATCRDAALAVKTDTKNQPQRVEKKSSPPPAPTVSATEASVMPPIP